MPAAGIPAPFRFSGPDGVTLTGLARPAAAAASGDAGPPPPLVFMPGTGFCVEAYGDLLAALPEDTAVHALNYRGHGGSDVPALRADWDGVVADVRAYVERELGVPAILSGHSMGAMVSLRLAAEAPELVAGLLLLEPPIHVRQGEEPPEDWETARAAFIERARNRRAEWPSREEAAKWFEGSVLYRLWTPGSRAGFVADGLRDTEAGTVRLATPPELEADYYVTVPSQPLYEYAAQARCTGVLLRGTESPVVPTEALEDIAAALPVGAVLPVPGTHTFPMEHPQETALRMAEALRLLRGETGLNVTEAAAGRTR